MAYFTPDYQQFFKELAANNNKDWFDKNRKRYESVVRDPFESFVTELIGEMAKSIATFASPGTRPLTN